MCSLTLAMGERGGTLLRVNSSHPQAASSPRPSAQGQPMVPAPAAMAMKATRIASPLT